MTLIEDGMLINHLSLVVILYLAEPADEKRSISHPCALASIDDGQTPGGSFCVGYDGRTH